ncbi:MAG TPA: TIGR03862 family flavoprotein [Ancylobacter sp.]
MSPSPGTDSPFPTIAVVGAGPAGLIAAETLAQAGCRVTIYDRMASPARKFLLAGRGGLNLTHSEPRERFLSRYREAGDWVAPMLDAYPPARLRAWAEGLGEPTFVGSSGRVFPRSFKASPLLRAWLGRLGELGVRLETRHTWLGWTDDGQLRFGTPEGDKVVAADAVLFALGGASWPRLGSDGGWVDTFAAHGIEVAPLRPSNSGVRIGWTDTFRSRFAGEPLKGIALSVDGESVRGEAMVTEGGLEGGAVYALSAPLREAIARDGSATLTIDLRPDLTVAALAARLAGARKGESTSNKLRKAGGLSAAAGSLVREAAVPPVEPMELAALIKAVPLTATAMASLDRAISTAGGVRHEMADADLMLRARPGSYVAGEMLDWEAPTGGYLLQACFASGFIAARGILARLGLPAPAPWDGAWDAAAGSEPVAI